MPPTQTVRNLQTIIFGKPLDGLSGQKIVSGYLPIGNEISPLPALTGCVAASTVVCVPVVDKPGHPLKFRQWTPEASLIRAEHGIQIPASGDWLQPRVLVVPLLAYDNRGYRLGYGGGYYDRTLEFLRRSSGATAIGFAYSAQKLHKVPAEAFDQRLDMVVTELGVQHFRAQS